MLRVCDNSDTSMRSRVWESPQRAVVEDEKERERPVFILWIHVEVYKLE